jgi:phage-related protein
MNTADCKELVWIGSSRKELRTFPPAVRRAFGVALYVAQCGERPPDVKALKSFGAGVLEIIEDYRSDTYRAVYTIRLAGRIYVLHTFQKKSKRGIATPKNELDVIRERLKWAERLHATMEKEKSNAR